MAQGRKAGIVSVPGIATGSIIHKLFAAFGLSVIIAQSITAFNIVKYAGAACLGYMGIKMLPGNSLLNVEEKGIKNR